MVLGQQKGHAAPNRTGAAEGAPMLTIAVIIAIWVVLSLPLSVVLGHSMPGSPEASPEPELLGMDGDLAVYRLSDGSLRRVSLTERTSA